MYAAILRHRTFGTDCCPSFIENGTDNAPAFAIRLTSSDQTLGVEDEGKRVAVFRQRRDSPVKLRIRRLLGTSLTDEVPTSSGSLAETFETPHSDVHVEDLEIEWLLRSNERGGIMFFPKHIRHHLYLLQE